MSDWSESRWDVTSFMAVSFKWSFSFKLSVCGGGEGRGGEGRGGEGKGREGYNVLS